MKHNSTLTATVGGVTATVSRADADAVNYRGLDAITITVPHALAGQGQVPVVVWADGKPANTVTVAFK